RLYRLSPDGREGTLAVQWSGQLFGTSALVGVGEQPALAEALQDSEICEMSAEEFLGVMAHHPRLAGRVMLTLAGQLLHLERQLPRQLVRPLPSRRTQVLHQLAEDNGGQLPPRLTPEQLAKRVGTTRESVSRALRQLAKQGLVEVGYRRLAIVDAEGLR